VGRQSENGQDPYTDCKRRGGARLFEVGKDWKRTSTTCATPPTMGVKGDKEEEHVFTGLDRTKGI